MDPSNIRRLAPAPSPSLNSGSPQPGPSTPGPSTKSSIKRASTACQSCKHIKRKCDQRQPCSNCVKASTECIYDQAQDGRRRAARKRNVEELELKRDALDTILDALRQSDDGHVQHLLNLIRSNAPLEDIIQYASLHETHFQEDQLTSLAVAVDTGLSRKAIMSISVLVDSPLVKVIAHPWTAVTSDNDLVSHLISTYFTWVHHAYPVVVEDLFIADMQAGDLSSHFCSPLLVNAMLAVACQFTDHPRAYQSPEDPTSRGTHFLDEAQRLWAQEAARPKLTNLQGGQIMALTLTILGKDRMAIPMIDQLNEMAAEAADRIQEDGAPLAQVQGYQRSLQFVLWAIYMTSIGWSLAFMRPHVYAIPVLDRPTSYDQVRRSVREWCPYPNSEPLLQFRCGNAYDLQYDLHQLGAKVVDFLYVKKAGEGDRVQALRRIEQDLDASGQMLPPSRSENIESGPINPLIMDIHLVYHWIRINLYNTIKNRKTEFESDAMKRYARSQCISSAKAIGRLFSRYLRDFGPKNLTIWMPQTAVTTAYVLIDDLDQPEIQDVFHEVCLVLTTVARRWYVMRGHSRVLVITADSRHQVIPERTRAILRMVAHDQWRAGDHKNFDTSLYPNYTLMTGETRRKTTMGDLLEQWADLDMDAGSPFSAAVSGPSIDGMAVSTGRLDSNVVSSRPGPSKGKRPLYPPFDGSPTQNQQRLSDGMMDGVDGVDGVNGVDGIDGIDGVDGIDGMDDEDERHGRWLPDTG